MKSLFLVLVSIGLAFASPIDPKQYSQEDLARLAEYSGMLQDQLQAKLSFVDAETDLAIGTKCVSNSDCPGEWTCENVEGAMYDIVNTTKHHNAVARLKHKARIDGKECIRPFNEALNQYSTDEVIDRIQELVDEIHEILGENAGRFDLDLSELAINNVDFDSLRLSVTRQTGAGFGDPSQLLFLILALRGSGGLSLDSDILLLLALTSFGAPGGGVDTNPLANPFLLFTLLNSNSGGSSNLQDLLLYSLFLSPGGIGAGGGAGFGADPFSNPLILFSLIGSNSGSNSDLLLLLVLSGGLGGGGIGGGAGGFESILPLLLLTNTSLGGTGGNNDLLLILLLSGGLGGAGGAGTGFESLLPLLLLNSGSSGSSSSNDDLLLLLLLSGGAAGDPGALSGILPLLLLTNLTGGSGGSTGNNDLLLLLLLSGGFGAGGAGGPGDISQLLPLLLIDGGLGSGTSGNNDNLLLLLLLSGGFGAGGVGGPGDISQLLPLLLIDGGLGSGTSGNNDILLLLLLSGGGLGGGVPGGAPGAFDFTQLLPLLLINQSGSDNIVLLLYLLQFFAGGAPPLAG